MMIRISPSLFCFTVFLAALLGGCEDEAAEPSEKAQTADKPVEVAHQELCRKGGAEYSVANHACV